MPLPIDLPIVDHHCHLSPTGEGVGAARRFAKAGGTHLFLATQNYAGAVPTSLQTYREQFAMTEELARRIGEETGVVAYPVLAPYPVDLLGAAAQIGLSAATELQFQALELAAHRVEEQAAVALGEVGRPHFPVPIEMAAASEAVFVRALETARDVGCPAVVHSEDLDANGYRSVADLASRASFPVGRLVKHYARAVVPAAVRQGIVPSFVARRELTTSSLAQDPPWFWETDFLDDPTRPGAVLDLATIPRRALAIAADPDRVDRLRIPFVESIETVYGFTPRTASRAGR
ncbi:MAG: TatD family hydrolase [Thermoplasmata archaeon]|nr:TatD family hydrolase [Thermoplasmata archaeon]